MNYIDIFKQIIKEEVIQSSGDKKFIDDLFHQIKESVIKTGKLLRLPQVDETTLKSYFELLKMNIYRLTQSIQDISILLTKKGFKTWLNEKREK